jgi:hypothetical protein
MWRSIATCTTTASGRAVLAEMARVDAAHYAATVSRQNRDSVHDHNLLGPWRQ